MFFFKLDDEELSVFSGLSDEQGEISKNDLIVHTKQVTWVHGYIRSIFSFISCCFSVFLLERSERRGVKV